MRTQTDNFFPGPSRPSDLRKSNSDFLTLKIMFDGHIYLNYFKFDVLCILNKS